MKMVYSPAIVALFTLSILVFASCKEEVEEAPVFHLLKSAPEKIDIGELSQTVDMIRDSIINPHGILSFGDYIILVDSRTSKALTIYNETTKEYRRFLSRGNANNEIKYASKIALVSAEEQQFLVRDVSYGRLFMLAIDPKTGEPVQKYTTNLNKFGKVSDFELDGSTVLACDMSTYNQFVIGSAPRKVEARFGNFSAYEFDRDSSLLGAIEYDGKIALDRKNNRMAYLSAMGETIEIIHYSEEHKDRILKVKREEPIEDATEDEATEDKEKKKNDDGYDEIAVVKDSVVVSKIFQMPTFRTKEKEKDGVISYTTTQLLNGQTKIAFGAAVASENYIYALYDGRTRTQATRKKYANPDGLYNNLCVFDWEGNFLLHIRSDLGVKAISYNDERGLLYCLCMTDTGEYEICTIAESEIFVER